MWQVYAYATWITNTHSFTNQLHGVNVFPKDRLAITQLKPDTLHISLCVCILVFAKISVLPKIQLGLESMNIWRG